MKLEVVLAKLNYQLLPPAWVYQLLYTHGHTVVVVLMFQDFPGPGNFTDTIQGLSKTFQEA